MAAFKLYLLTADVEKGSYFGDVISSFKGQLSDNTLKTDVEFWKSSLIESNNYSFNEKISIHQNAQKEFSFDMASKYLWNNRWISNPFVERLSVGSLILLTDKYDNNHLFIVKTIKTQLLEINTVYSYECQDAFSYILTRQNEGYSISNDPTSTDFIGAKTLDWWVNKICDECYIADKYVTLEEIIYKKYNKKIAITTKEDSITDSIKIIKTSMKNMSAITDNSITTETFSFSCDGSSALNAILSLCELVGFTINTYEEVIFIANQIKIQRYFWLEPSKIENISPYLYSPKKNIESFSFDQNGDSLTTVLNVKSHNIGDESVSLLPVLPPRFATWFQTQNWENSIYKTGFFTELLEGKTLTTSGDFPNLFIPDMDEMGEFSFEEIEGFSASNYSLVDGRIWIPIFSDNSTLTLDLTWWDNRIKFSQDDNLCYCYLTVDDISAIYNTYSFLCDLRIRQTANDSFTILHEYEEIPTKFRGEKVYAYFTIPAPEGLVKMWMAPKILLHIYSDISEDERYFATLADQIPWLENKIIDFSYFYQQGVLTNNEYVELMSKITNDLRIINGKLLCYAHEYYHALQTKVELLADLETAAETLHAELEAEGISKYAQDGAVQDLRNFLSKNRDLNSKYSSIEKLYGAQEIQNNYLNKYFNSQQSFLKNIYKFRQYFYAPSGESVTYHNKYDYTITRNSSKYISFSPNGFISCADFGVQKLNYHMTFYEKTQKDKIDVYSKTSVVTPLNYEKYYIQNNTSQIYNNILSGAQYNENNQYYILGEPFNKDFIQKVLQISDVQVNTYYILTKTQLQQYYLYCVHGKLTSTSPFYIKEEVGMQKLSDIVTDTEILNTDCLYFEHQVNVLDDEGNVTGTKTQYDPITYKRNTDKDFQGWKAVAGFYDNPTNKSPKGEDSNPYLFLKENNYTKYVSECGQGATGEIFASASGIIDSAIARWDLSTKTFKASTYENYFQYRIALTPFLSPQESSDKIYLFTPNIYYQKVNFSTAEILSGLYWSSSFTQDIVYSICNNDFVFIDTVDGCNDIGSFYKLIDFTPCCMNPTNTSAEHKEKFYARPIEIYSAINGEPINVLTDMSGNLSLGSVCDKLYVLTPEQVKYIQPSAYDSTITYYESKDDGFVRVAHFEEVKTQGAKYYIENSLNLHLEDFGKIGANKEVYFNFYLNENSNNEIITYKYPKLYKITLTPNTEGVVQDTSIDIAIDHEGNVFTGTLNISHSYQEDRNNYHNGDFWYHHIKNDNNKLYQEKALVIEQQLTEYWQQAYSASKYCDFFIPEHWQFQMGLVENKYFNRLFSVVDDSLTILSAIPNVSIYAPSNKTTSKYELIWDPYGTQSSGQLANKLDNNNPIFKSLANEVLGGVDNLYKLKIELNENIPFTYYYLTSGGWRWRDVIKQISSQGGEMFDFTGLYGLMFKWSQGFVENELSTYSQLLQQKETLWKELHITYPNLFLEGTFEYPTATTSSELLKMAQYAFMGKSKPENNYSVSILDIFSLKGYNGEELKIGYPIMIDATQYQLENINLQKAIDQYLFITDISYNLRSDVNISITVNSIKYDDKLIQKLVKLIR